MGLVLHKHVLVDHNCRIEAKGPSNVNLNDIFVFINVKVIVYELKLTLG